MSIPYKGGKLPDYIKDTDLPLLGAGLKVVRPDGQWLDYIPEYETQLKQIDPYTCVSFSALSALEIYAKAVHSLDINKSDKFTGVMSGTIPYKGNSFRNVAESIKRDWTVDEEVYPYNDTTIDSYFKPVPQAIKDIALADKPNYQYFYRYALTTWYFDNNDTREKEDVIVEALQYTPLQISIKYPTKKPVKGVYQAEHGENHAVVLVGFVYGKEWIIFDSYDPAGNGGIKRLAWDYPIYGVVAHTLEPVSNDRDVILRDYRGQLIKNDWSVKVYYVDKMGLQIAWIENEEKFKFNVRQGWHGNWDKIKTVDIPIHEDITY